MLSTTRSFRPWLRTDFYGFLFWIWMAIMLFADAHVPTTWNNSLYYRSIWQLGFMVIAVGWLSRAIPQDKREAFMKFNGVNAGLLFLFGPLTIPGYLWRWYGWKRALRFMLFTCLYLVVFLVATIAVEALSPGTFDL